MKNKKNYEIVIFIALCILANFCGKILANRLELPLWADSFGTLSAAYVCGPFCGAVVGASVNIINGFIEPFSYVYSLTSIAVGTVAGYCARKKMFETLFGTMSAAFLIALASIIVSVPLNCIFYSGYTGNKWGDGIIDMLLEWDILPVLSYAAGEFDIDFPDKLLGCVFLAAAIDLYRGNYGKKRINHIMCALLAVSAASGMLFFETNAYAASDDKYGSYVQTVYDDSRGLPGGTANAIAQTKDGILWVGTYGGLYRYSGTKFEWINQFDSVKNVNCFCVDESGRLWIGTNDRGLSIYINDSISNTLDKDDGLPSDSVRCIAEASDGNYYVGTTDSLAMVKLSDGLSVTDVIPRISYAVSVSVDADGYAAAVTDAGELFLIDKNEVKSEIKYEKQDQSYTCCTFGENGMLYVGTSENVVDIYEISSGKLVKSTSAKSSELSYFQSFDRLNDSEMIACADNGVAVMDSEGQCEKIGTGKFDNSVEQSLVDYQGNLWLVSSRLGLMRLSASIFTDVFANAELEETVVNTVQKWQGNMYFGTDSGLRALNSDMSGEIQNTLTKQLEGVRIRCLRTDSRNRLWICTSGKGVLCVSPDAQNTTVVYDAASGALGDRFRTVLELSDKTMAVAGDSGVTFVKDGKVTGTVGAKEGIENPKILCLMEMNGTLLAGSDGGGIYEIKDMHAERKFSKENGLGSEIILRMVKDEENGGAFIVQGSGISYMDEQYNISAVSSFPYYNNYEMYICEDGTIFVPGSAGIYVTDRKTMLDDEGTGYVLLDSQNGLSDALTPNAWNYADDEGNLYMACSTGVLCFNSKDYIDPKGTYRMQLRSVKADDIACRTRVGETVTIPAGTSRIELESEIINYSAYDPYVSVYLEGADSEPRIMLLSEMTNAVYTNIPSGKYAFHIAVLDENNEPAEEIVYELEKKKEIYDYWWFKLYALTVGTLSITYLTWMLFRTQIQKALQMQKKELEMAKRQVEMGNETIMTIAKTVDAKDVNTSEHSERVSEYSVLIAKKLGFGEEDCEELRKTALLHDIGKIGIPDSILNKPARFTDEEYEIMKSHVVKGADILKNFTSAGNIADGARYHHERYDGKGYVSGLKGEEIPLNARIIGIADAFDAMTANRVYRNHLDMKRVLSELEKGRGTQFDPKITDIMLELIHSGEINVQYPEEEGNET